jgi:hypothetical protein
VLNLTNGYPNKNKNNNNNNNNKNNNKVKSKPLALFELAGKIFRSSIVPVQINGDGGRCDGRHGPLSQGQLGFRAHNHKITGLENWRENQPVSLAQGAKRLNGLFDLQVGQGLTLKLPLTRGHTPQALDFTTLSGSTCWKFQKKKWLSTRWMLRRSAFSWEKFVKKSPKKCQKKSVKWDVQLWGFGSLFLNSLMHCLAERPKKYIFELLLIHLWFFINDFYFLEFFLKNFFFLSASPGSAGCFKTPTQIPNAGPFRK